jgi:tetratricopeptide (TPR) repeat protein
MLWDRADQQVVVEKWEEVYATGRKAVRIAPKSADAWALFAYVEWLPSHVKSAEAACRRALELNPRCYRAFHVQSLILYDQGKLEEAVAASRKAVELSPGYARAHAQLGSALTWLGQAEEGVAQLQEATRLVPGSFELQQELTWALGNAGRLEEGFQANARASGLAHTDLEKLIVHNNAAYLYAFSGDGEAALREARAALDLNPNDSDVLDTLGAMNALFGHPEASEAPLRKALKSSAHWSGTHTALAYSLACRGQDAAAREELAKVSKELVAENVSLDALYFAGLAYNKLGETTIARRIFSRATQRWPLHPWSQKMRQYLAGP